MFLKLSPAVSSETRIRLETLSIIHQRLICLPDRTVALLARLASGPLGFSNGGQPNPDKPWNAVKDRPVANRLRDRQHKNPAPRTPTFELLPSNKDKYQTTIVTNQLSKIVRTDLNTTSATMGQYFDDHFEEICDEMLAEQEAQDAEYEAEAEAEAEADAAAEAEEEGN
ncbi:hypothetical protein TI39_contig4339g00002 [Zymoseptoria brevis]|uniref:Uncharacterized protein n=1 Tax=Zymoseptoria brevis TaxID=1047168 RepID=A0A0F4G7J5_9PEZI|nr:hypothetical protein TI39_contig4339g00002 [Zymoseptoria brevis]